VFLTEIKHTKGSLCVYAWVFDCLLADLSDHSFFPHNFEKNQSIPVALVKEVYPLLPLRKAGWIEESWLS